MEGETRKPAWGRRWKATLAALFVADILIVSSAAAWQVVWRPRSVAELAGMTSFTAGTTVDIEGQITLIDRWNSTYGPMVALILDGGRGCSAAVLGDPAVDYAVGQRIRTTLHFQEYRMNGDRAVTAPELPCPLPLDYATLGPLSFDLALNVRGFGLSFSSYSTDGWATYEVVTRNGDAYPLGLVPVALWKRDPIGNATSPYALESWDAWDADWNDEWGRLYTNYSLHATQIDSMASLGDAASRTGLIRYVDRNADGLLDDGDRIQLRLDPTAGNAYETYILDLAAFPGFNPSRLFGGRYILNGPEGPYDILGESLGVVQLRHVSDHVGPSVNSTLEVGGLRGTTPSPYGRCAFTLYAGDGSLPGDRGFITQGTLPLHGNLTITFDDGNGDGLLDAGDAFLITGLTNRTTATLSVDCGNLGRGSLRWYPGVGYVALPFPPVDLTPTPSPPYRVDVRVAYPHPDLAFARNVTVTLQEAASPYFDYQTVLDEAPLRNGTIGTFGSGGSLAFVDADGNGALSTGDRFDLQGTNSTSDYRLWVSVLFGAYSSSAYIQGQ